MLDKNATKMVQSTCCHCCCHQFAILVCLQQQLILSFSSKEEEQIKAHLATAMSAHGIPGLEACRAFLAKIPVNRITKQIQDKVKNFIK